MTPRRPARSRTHVAGRLLTLPAGELVDLFRAQLELVVARTRVRRRPTGALLRPLPTATPRRGKAPDEVRLEHLAVAIDRASRLGLFRPTCLVRAMALESLIRRSNAGSAIVRVGVARGTNALLAHAWIELGGRVIGDDTAYVRQFTPLQDFSALAP